MNKQPDSIANKRILLAEELTPEQLVTLEKIERLAELDPEITERLARALDRLQMTRPYQPLSRAPRPSSDPSPTPPRPQLSEAERLLREEFITQELGALLAVAGQLVQRYTNTANREARPDKHFRDSLRAQLFAPPPSRPKPDDKAMG